MTRYRFRAVSAIDEIPRSDWDALADDHATPFTDYRWLHALEASGCVAADTGWSPRHLTLWDGKRLVAAAPAYLRDDSHGDFGRDWDLASAAQRARIRYYPKLSITVPFTPATGRRLLVAPGADRAACIAALVEGARGVAREARAANIQVLFPDEEEIEALRAAGMGVRIASFQYHWRNANYKDPANFVARLDSKRRHQLKRERAAPVEQGITIRTVREGELSRDPIRWARTMFTLHRTTLDKLPWGQRWVNRDFYERVVSAMPEHVEIVAAEREGRVIAGAFNVASKTHLYGRYWGCVEEHRFLHFNVCLYHSIDECIRRGTLVFEGGAQGEHKLTRGFEPSPTFSAHMALDARFDAALRQHFEAEWTDRQAALARFQAEAAVLKPAKPA